jgi:hypothetical protein
MYPTFEYPGVYPLADPMLRSSHEGRIAIVGRPNTGKKSLCNSLWDWQVLDSDETDTTIRNLGLIHIITLPEDAYEIDNVLFHLERFDLVIYLLDAHTGMTRADFQWLARLRAGERVLLVALNRANQMNEQTIQAMVSDMESRLLRPVIPLAANERRSVQEQLLPAVLRLCPDLGVPLAGEVRGLRGQVAARLIQEAMLASSLDGSTESAAGRGFTLKDRQLTMVNRIAALYGFRAQQDDRMRHTLAAALEFVYAQEPFSKLNDRMQSSLLAGLSTWLIGRLAVLYYEIFTLNVFARRNGRSRKQANGHGEG